MVLGLCIANEQDWIYRLNGLFMHGPPDGSTVIFQSFEELHSYAKNNIRVKGELYTKRVITCEPNLNFKN